MTLTDQELKVVEAMRTYGGSFIQSLAECFIHADEFNKAILKNAFRRYWNEYEQTAKQNYGEEQN